jgi:hypothetical protein
VVVVVADLPRRRAVLVDVLSPGRLGVEVAILGGTRCAPPALAARLALAAGRPGLLMLDYDALAAAALPEDVHLVVLDPPRSPQGAATIRSAAAGRWLHLVWGEHEVEFTRGVAEARWNLRPVAAEVWRALRDGLPRAWDAALEAELLGDGAAVRDPHAVADAVVALTQIGLLSAGPEGLRAVPGAPARPLDEAPRARDCAASLAAETEFLDLASTLDVLAGEAVAAPA